MAAPAIEPTAPPIAAAETPRIEPPTDPPIAVPAAARMIEAMAQLGSGNRKAKAMRRRQAASSGDLDDAAALVGVDEAVGRGDDAAVLGDGAGAHPEQEQRAGHELGRRPLEHHRPGRLGERLAVPVSPQSRL